MKIQTCKYWRQLTIHDTMKQACIDCVVRICVNFIDRGWQMGLIAVCKWISLRPHMTKFTTLSKSDITLQQQFSVCVDKNSTIHKNSGHFRWFKMFYNFSQFFPYISITFFHVAFDLKCPFTSYCLRHTQTLNAHSSSVPADWLITFTLRKLSFTSLTKGQHARKPIWVEIICT